MITWFTKRFVYKILIGKITSLVDNIYISRVERKTYLQSENSYLLHKGLETGHIILNSHIQFNLFSIGIQLKKSESESKILHSCPISFSILLTSRFFNIKPTSILHCRHFRYLFEAHDVDTVSIRCRPILLHRKCRIWNRIEKGKM